MKPMVLAYIAGPLGADTPLERRRNIERARDLAHRVAQCGLYPITPHLNTGEFYGTLDEQTLWIPGTMELLQRCDCIVLTDDWRDSPGARKEKEWSDRVLMPAFVYDESLEGFRGEDSAMSELHRFCTRMIARQRDAFDYMHWPRIAQ